MKEQISLILGTIILLVLPIAFIVQVLVALVNVRRVKPTPNEETETQGEEEEC
jgi:hypothetical protein